MAKESRSLLVHIAVKTGFGTSALNNALKYGMGKRVTVGLPTIDRMLEACSDLMLELAIVRHHQKMGQLEVICEILKAAKIRKAGAIAQNQLNGP